MGAPKVDRREAFVALDDYRRDAEAGASDALISSVSGFGTSTVGRWRLSRGIAPHTPRPQEELVEAMRVFDHDNLDALHRVDESHAIGGQMDTPKYVLRVPLRFDAFCRCAHFLQTQLGMPSTALGDALGVRARDIDRAVDVWERHLTKHGRPCLGCGTAVDPRFGDVCSARCGGGAK